MIVNKKEPKVLVIAANPFSDINNNGKTLKSIFSAFHKESLYELYFRPQDNIIGDGEFAQSYYAFCEMDIIRSIIHFSKKCGGIQTFEKGKAKEIAEDKTYRSFLNGNLKNIKWLRSLLWKTRRWDTKEYRDWLRACNPDIVFALLGGPGTSYTIAQEISKQFNVPLAVYFTDDYLIHPVRKNWLDKWRYIREEKHYRKIITASSALFTIGELMSKEYSAYFGKEFDCIMNSVSLYPFVPKTTISHTKTIAYFGGLNLNRWKMISRFSELVSGKARVLVYTGQEITDEIDKAFKISGVELGGFLKGEEVRTKMLESDILLHIESDDKYYRSLTCLSVSTKIPEYLMSSRPVVAYGPAEIASIRLISDNNLGITISSEESEANQKNVLFKFLDNEEQQQLYVKRAYDYASSHFDKDKVSEGLRNKIIQICKNH